MDYIDETVAYLGPAIDRNFDVWGYTFEEYRPLDPDSRNPEHYEAAVEQMKDFHPRSGEPGWTSTLRSSGSTATPPKTRNINH